MSRVNSGSRFGGERIKLALIPVLGLILVAIAFWPAKTEGVPASAATSSLSAANSAAALNQTAAGPSPIWPEIRLDDLVAHNPFEPRSVPVPKEMPAASPTAAGNPDPAPAEPPAHPPGQLQAIYHDARGAAAILDSQIVRVGDVLEDGSRIVAITSQGIELEPQ